MQKCFLVSNKVTQVREYLEHRSIIEIVDERRTLQDIDLTRLGIIDVDKFLYIYYESDDGDLGFRSDLNTLRQLLASAFFHTSEGIFILVNCQNAMLEDMIKSACKDSNLIGSKLDIVHHSGVLTLSDVSKYIAGSAFGTQTSSSYKVVYIKEEESEERERFANDSGSLGEVLPELTDQYSMYKKRAEVESLGSSRTVTETFERPQILRTFSKREKPTIQQWRAFLISGVEYTRFEDSVGHLVEYYGRLGYRSMIIDLTNKNSSCISVNGLTQVSLQELSSHVSFSSRAAMVKARYDQLGYVVETLDNVVGIHTYIFVCDSNDYELLTEYLSPLCSELYTNFVTHFSEDAVLDYLRSDKKSTTLFLSNAVVDRKFDVVKYKEEFKGTRVAPFRLENVDTTEFYECAVGGALT